MIYAMGDIHGEYDQLVSLIEKIDLKDNDTLYVLGDVIDRGPNPVECLIFLKLHPNITVLAGNHELMGYVCLDYLMRKLDNRPFLEPERVSERRIEEWKRNGGKTTLKEFAALSPDIKKEILEYIETFIPYKELTVAGKDYVLVHAGFDNFSEDRPFADYSLNELVWIRTEYFKPYFKDKITITGHTPTQFIPDNPEPGFIYKANNHIALDCGPNMENGRLACICLDTGEEFYSR